MKKLLKERFQELAGIKPLYGTIDEQAINPNACSSWLSTMVTGGGDINCCNMLQGNMTGQYGDDATVQMLDSHCSQEWQDLTGTIVPPGSYPWAACCEQVGIEPTHTPDRKSVMDKSPARNFRR